MKVPLLRHILYISLCIFTLWMPQPLQHKLPHTRLYAQTGHYLLHSDVLHEALYTPHRRSYFDTQFLRNASDVYQQMITDGFQDGYIVTSDHEKLHYVYFEHINAPYTVIFCTGFYPGHKEGLASFFSLLPQPCNLLFFDARGHGNSSGDFISSILNYGKHEYRDVLAALNFVTKRNNKPIYLYGNCAGAFHAARALVNLTEHNLIDHYPIHGLIFDSGWGSVQSVSWSAPQAHVQQYIQNIFKPYKNDIINRTGLYIASTITHAILSFVHTVFFQPFFHAAESETNLYDKINKITTPIFFIHSTDDRYVSFYEIKKLAQRVTNKLCWWIRKPSKHACHHLKFTQKYREKILTFIQQTCYRSSIRTA